LSKELLGRIEKVRLLIVDNDGVMTDGRIVYGDHGDELKFFDIHDGHGLVMLRRAGLKAVMISGKKSRVNKRRMKDVGFSELYQNAKDKLAVYEKVLKKHRLSPEEVCYIGDDLIDLPPMTRSGLAVAVANAVPEVKAAAHHVTERPGGRGAVRETIDMILKGKGLWEEVTKRYFR
jgi:3-deoxy-D-manno-octulosonate 8-phosphate phosphatase (KDO 8-P phosphatase)